jgi:hypothetical protein
VYLTILNHARDSFFFSLSQDKFIRAPARATLAFASPGQAGTQFQAGTHLAVAPMPTNQTSSTALTLQPIVLGTTNTAKAVGAPRQTALHPIGPKVCTL